jgi:hypothetical protein
LNNTKIRQKAEPLPENQCESLLTMTRKEVEAEFAEIKASHNCGAPDVYSEFENTEHDTTFGTGITTLAVLRCRNCGGLEPLKVRQVE